MDIVIVYEAHPAAKLFPESSQQDYDTLKADIKANGQRFPIIVRGTSIIDGCTRFKVCQELGIKPWIQALPDGEDPWQYAYSANLARRHLTDDQRAICSATFAERNPKATGAAAHKAKSDPMGVGVEPVAKTGAAAANPALAEGAKKFSVSMTKAKKARALLKKDPAKAKEVHEGKTSLAKASRQVEGKRAKSNPAPGLELVCPKLQRARTFLDEAKKLLDTIHGTNHVRETNRKCAETLKDIIGTLNSVISDFLKARLSAEDSKPGALIKDDIYRAMKALREKGEVPADGSFHVAWIALYLNRPQSPVTRLINKMIAAGELKKDRIGFDFVPGTTVSPTKEAISA